MSRSQSNDKCHAVACYFNEHDKIVSYPEIDKYIRDMFAMDYANNEELYHYLLPYNLPCGRIDLTKSDNILWLDRNILIHNQSQPNIMLVTKLLRSLRKQMKI